RASALSAILTVSASAQELFLSAADGGRAQDRLRHLEPLSSCLAVTEAAHLDHARVLHQTFVGLCDLEPGPIVAEERRLHWFSYEATAPGYFNYTANTHSNLHDARKVGIAVERRILDVFLPFDKRDNLVCQSSIESPLRMPGCQPELRIVARSWKILKNILYRLRIHLDHDHMVFRINTATRNLCERNLPIPF